MKRPFLGLSVHPFRKGGRFSPLNELTVQHLYHADSGITLSGTTVSGWSDQKGTNHASQLTAAAQPGYDSAAFGGRNSLIFDGTKSLPLTGGGKVSGDWYLIAGIIVTNPPQGAWWSNRNVFVAAAGQSQCYLGHTGTAGGSVVDPFSFHNEAAPTPGFSPTGASYTTGAAAVHGYRVTGGNTARHYKGLTAGSADPFDSGLATNPSLGWIGGDKAGAGNTKARMRVLLIGRGAVTDARWNEMVSWVATECGVTL